MPNPRRSTLFLLVLLIASTVVHESLRAKPPKPGQDGRNTEICVPPPTVSGDWKADELDYKKHGIFENESPTADKTAPVATTLPLTFEQNDCVAFVGNTLLDRARMFGHLETYLQQRFAEQQLTFRNLAWPADAVDLKPRPDNFATEIQHLTRVEADVIFAAYGFNESFAGVERLDGFRVRLRDYLEKLKSYAFNGKTGPRIVLISPIANENVDRTAAADMNNERLATFTLVMKEVAAEANVGFIHSQRCR